MLRTTRDRDRRRDPRQWRRASVGWRTLRCRFERLLRRFAAVRLQRIGLSAAQKPIEEVARMPWWASRRGRRAAADRRQRPLPSRATFELGVPPSPLEAVMSAEVWDQVYDRLAELHREATARRSSSSIRGAWPNASAGKLSDRLGAVRVAAHHGRLAKEQRLDAEPRLKSGALSAMVARPPRSSSASISARSTSSAGSAGRARSAAFLRRVERPRRHSVGGQPKGRLFPLPTDDLVGMRRR